NAVIGMNVDDAIALLHRHGVTATTQEQLDASHPDGTVLSVTSTGATSVQLDVSRTGATTFLNDLNETTRGQVGGATEEMGGKPFPHSMSGDMNACISPARSPLSLEWDLGKHYRKFQMTVGVTDDS